MEWWSDLWLNEAFATLSTYMCLDHLKPEWKVVSKLPDLSKQFCITTINVPKCNLQRVIENTQELSKYPNWICI